MLVVAKGRKGIHVVAVCHGGMKKLILESLGSFPLWVRVCRMTSFCCRSTTSTSTARDSAHRPAPARGTHSRQGASCSAMTAARLAWSSLSALRFPLQPEAAIGEGGERSGRGWVTRFLN